jgi:hypothetical protein
MPDHEEKLRAYRERVAAALSKMETKGIVFLVIQYIWHAFKDKMRRNHDWLGVLVPTMDTQARDLSHKRTHPPAPVERNCTAAVP